MSDKLESSWVTERVQCRFDDSEMMTHFLYFANFVDMLDPAFRIGPKLLRMTFLSANFVI